MTASESLSAFLLKLGTTNRGERYILDGFNHEFYLIFDTEDDPDTPDAVGTCDIYVARVGASTHDSSQKIRVVCNARRHNVMRFLFSLGAQQFSMKTKSALYEMNNVLRTQ